MLHTGYEVHQGDRAVEETRTVRVVLIKEGDLWIAQCLEFDVGAQAEGMDELQRRFEVALQCEIDECIRAGVSPDVAIGPAPQFYYDLWNKQAGEFKPRMPAHLHGRALSPEYGLVA